MSEFFFVCTFSERVFAAIYTFSVSRVKVSRARAYFFVYCGAISELLSAAKKPAVRSKSGRKHIHTVQGVLYRSAIRDLFDNSIVVHKTGTTQTINLVLDTI